jgi:hypothetical protein
MRREITYQLTIEPTCIAVQLVVKPTSPKRSMSRATVRTLGLDSARSGIVAVPTNDSRVNAGGSGTRTRRTCDGRSLSLDCKVRPTVGGITSGTCAGANLRGNGPRSRLLDSLRKWRRARVSLVVVARGLGLYMKQAGVLHDNVQVSRSLVFVLTLVKHRVIVLRIDVAE